MADATEVHCLKILEARSTRSRCHVGRCLLRSPSLACRWPSSPFIVTWSFLRVGLYSNLLVQANSRIELGPTRMNSFNLNSLFKDPLSKYSHIFNIWLLGGHNSAHNTIYAEQLLSACVIGKSSCYSPDRNTAFVPFLLYFPEISPHKISFPKTKVYPSKFPMTTQDHLFRNRSEKYMPPIHALGCRVLFRVDLIL